MLDKEIEGKRDQVLLLRIDETPPPAELRGRLWLSLQGRPRSEIFDQLADFFRSKGLSDHDVPLDHAMIPVVFSKIVHLRRAEFQHRIDDLRQHHSKSKPEAIAFKPEQFLVLEEDNYKRLRSKLYSTLDEIEQKTYYTPEIEDTLRILARTTREREHALKCGLAMIAENVEPGFVGLSAYEFARIFRSGIVGRLWSSQISEAGDTIDFGSDLDDNALASNTRAEKFFGAAVRRVQIFDPDTDEYVGIWVPETSFLWREFKGYTVPYRAAHILPFELYQFVVPHMLDQVLRGVATPLTWNFSKWRVGKA